jgi:hypothetical protein
MVDDATERVLWMWTAQELAVFVVVGALLVAGLVGETTLWTSVSRRLRLGALAFVAVQLLAPLWVYVDLRRRGDDSGTMWVHVAAMPLLNVFGLVAYLDYRRRAAGE